MSNFNDYNNYDNRGSRRGGNAVVLISVALVMLMLGALIGVVIYQGVDKQEQAVLGSEVTTQQPTATPEATPELRLLRPDRGRGGRRAEQRRGHPQLSDGHRQ